MIKVTVVVAVVATTIVGVMEEAVEDTVAVVSREVMCMVRGSKYRWDYERKTVGV